MYVPKGALLVTILTEGTTTTNTATRANLDSWIAATGTMFTAALDSEPPQQDMETYFSVSRDSYVIIDLKDMKILKVITIADGGVNRALTELGKLL